MTVRRHEPLEPQPGRRRPFLRRSLLAALVGLAVLAGVYAVGKVFEKPSKKPVALYEGPYVEDGGRVLTRPRVEGELSLFLAGDTILMKPWSENRDPAFLKVIDEIRAADAAIVNLEMVVTEFKGFAQADSGGGWLAGPPAIAGELAWAGIDMVGHANNHTFDYGSIGVLETVENVRRAGLVLAGSGADLQRARAPAYFETPNGTVALVAAASSFVPYGKASRSRPDLHGRPGVNPLTRYKGLQLEVTPETAERLRQLTRMTGKRGHQFLRPEFTLFGLDVRVGDKHSIARAPRADKADVAANLAAVRQAAEQSDLVVLSIHAHEQGDWFEDFARKAIDAGADVLLAHGPHVMRGLEIYQGKPIIYSPGDFVFQDALVPRLPVEAYDEVGLGDDATPAQFERAASRDGTVSYPAWREVWEGVGVTLRFKDGELIELRLIPLDLRFGEPPEVRGEPRYAAAELGRHIIEFFANRSRRYGTEVLYAAEHNFGLVKLN